MRKKIQHHKSRNMHGFSDEKLFLAMENVDIPITIGNPHIILNTDIVATNIPFLLSRKKIKKADQCCK